MPLTDHGPPFRNRRLCQHDQRLDHAAFCIGFVRYGHRWPLFAADCMIGYRQPVVRIPLINLSLIAAPLALGSHSAGRRHFTRYKVITRCGHTVSDPIPSSVSLDYPEERLPEPIGAGDRITGPGRPE